MIKRLATGNKADEVAVADKLSADEDGDRVDAALLKRIAKELRVAD